MRRVGAETERERERERERETKRERIPSRFHAVSTEPDTRLRHLNQETMT